MVTTLCSSGTRNKKRMSEVFKPILEKLTNLGSMDPDDLSDVLYEEVKGMPMKDSIFVRESVSSITSALRSNKVWNVIISG